MVATVGSISIDLSTNTAKFTQGFKQSATTVERESKRMSKSVAGIQGSFKSLTGAIGSFGAGLAGGAAFAGLTSLTGIIGKAREAIGRLDDIADRAKTSGIGTDLLQSLEHGAQQAGLEVADMGGALTFFAKGMGQASEGTGRLYAGLLKLNPELLRNVLNAKDQEERLKLVAEALDKTKDAAKRAALSAALFGDADMARVFEGGAAGIDKMVAAAKELGIHSAEEIKRAHEYDEALTDINKSINATVDSLVINLGDALVGTSKLFQAGIEGAGNYIKQVKELALTLQAFEQDPSGKNLADFLLGPKGGGSVAGFFRDLVAGVDDTKQSFAELQQEANDTEIALAELYEKKREGFPVDEDIAKTAGHLEYLQRQLREIGALFAINQKRSALAQQFRESENASMAGVRTGKLPRVIGSALGGPDSDVMDKVEAAIDEGTKATYITGRYNRDAVQQLDSHTAGYFDGLGARFEGGFRDMGTALRSLPWNLRTAAAADSMGDSGSWAGRQFTSRGGTGDFGGSTDFGADPFGVNRYMMASTQDTSSITEGGGAPSVSVVNNIVMPPTFTGQLSTQSRAELKQAASAGANAALRAFYGR
jgi:hypothetical protein